ncbi:MAG: hypothetical protein ACYCZF_07130 [Anaerolineae bacterium]
MEETRSAYVWDYDINEQQFNAILNGDLVIGRLDQDWAACRLIEYASYRDMMRLIGLQRFMSNWPRWRTRIRSVSRRRGLDFLAKWLPEKHPEYLQ